MDKAKLVQVSKFMSLVLRHKPEAADIKLDVNGWVLIDDLISGMNSRGRISLSREDISFVVQNDDKKRYSVSEDGTRIRAAQGHSVKIDAEQKECAPPDVLYHGTSSSNKDSIFETGLNKGNRLHVHLSSDRETAIKVGSRKHGKVLIFVVDAKRMHEFGYKFYLSDNGVWLTDFIPPSYLKVSTI